MRLRCDLYRQIKGTTYILLAQSVLIILVYKIASVDRKNFRRAIFHVLIFATWPLYAQRKRIFACLIFATQATGENFPISGADPVGWLATPLPL